MRPTTYKRRRRVDDLAAQAVILAVAITVISVCIGIVYAVWRAIL